MVVKLSMLENFANVSHVKPMLMECLGNSLWICQVGWAIIFYCIDNCWYSLLKQIFCHLLKQSFLFRSLLICNKLDLCTYVDIYFYNFLFFLLLELFESPY